MVNREWIKLLDIHSSIKQIIDFDEKNSLFEHLTMKKLKVIHYVFVNSARELNLKEISENSGVTAGAASQTIDFLVKLGFIMRRESEHDRRSIVITLSEKGMEMIKDYKERVQDLVEKMLGGISEEEIDTFYRVLTQLSNNLTKERSIIRKGV